MQRVAASVSLLALLALPSLALAQRQQHPPNRPHGGGGQENTMAAGEAAAPAPTLGDMATIVPKLHSANQDEVREAIDLLTVIDRPEVVPPLAELLRSGQPDAITDYVLDRLAA